MVEADVSREQLNDLLANSGYWRAAAADDVAPLVYNELRRLAHSYMTRERPDHTLQTTALVNEAYLHLAGQTNPQWQNRNHFFAAAARMMRHILVNYAKSRNAQKRGAGAQKLELDDAAMVSETQASEIVALNEALQELAQLDPRKAQVVELKYFGGLTYEEIAEVLDISFVTVRRDWEFAKAWLHKELSGPEA